MTLKLTDLQLVLLASAAGRADGSLLPPPESVEGQRTRIARAIPPLIKRGLVTEVDVTQPTQAWRADDERHVGVVITNAGREAIGIEITENAAEPASDAAPSSSTASVTADGAIADRDALPRTSKRATVLDLLRREQGATLTELVTTTGWLPHTTRAALTGLRKKGHAIAKIKRDDVTCYRIVEAA